SAQGSTQGYDAPESRPHTPALRSLAQDPTTRLERDALMAMLQLPEAVGADLLAQAITVQVQEPSLRVVRDAIAVHLGSAGEPHWVDKVLSEVPESHQ